MLNESLKAIRKKILRTLTLKGGPGVGKTDIVRKDLEKEKIDYTYINSYTTPLSFYELLYQSKDKDCIVCDDIQGIHHPIILSMLKAACWESNGEKIVSYNSTTSELDKRELPTSFSFQAGVILIFNEKIKGYEPIMNRGVTIDFNFTYDEKIKIFEEIKEDANIEDEVLEYVKENCNDATENLSIRTLVILSELHRNKQDFKIFAEEILKLDQEKNLLLSLSADEWSNKTGYHKRTYWKHKARMMK